MLKHLLSSRTIILAGLCVLISGFIYDVVFAGIPYQDPTPEMTASYAFHAGIASAIRWCGVALLLVGGTRSMFMRSRNDRKA